MKALLQRVDNANVVVKKEVISQITTGILVFVGIEKEDSTQQADKMINKILNYRLFNDSNNKMNLNIQDIDGELLIVSQFTLAADTNSGTRAGFSTTMPPITAKKLYRYFLKTITAKFIKTKSGIFGEDMQISLCNNGPVSFMLETK